MMGVLTFLGEWFVLALVLGLVVGQCINTSSVPRFYYSVPR